MRINYCNCTFFRITISDYKTARVQLTVSNNENDSALSAVYYQFKIAIESEPGLLVTINIIQSNNMPLR